MTEQAKRPHVVEIAFAAALGDGWFASANDGIDALRRQVAVYQEAAAAEGRAPGEVALLRDGFVAESRAAARAVLEAPLLAKYREYDGWKSTSVDADRYAGSWEEALPRLVAGSPAECVERIGRYAELGVTTLVLRCQFPGLGHLATLRCIERFGTHVMPHVLHPAAGR